MLIWEINWKFLFTFSCFVVLSCDLSSSGFFFSFVDCDLFSGLRPGAPLTRTQDWRSNGGGVRLHAFLDFPLVFFLGFLVLVLPFAFFTIAQ